MGADLGDAMNVVRTIYMDPRLVPGGGATEMALAQKLVENSKRQDPKIASAYLDQDTLVLWLVWDKKIHMLVMKLNPREVSLPLNTQLNTVLLPTGMIWKKSGITLSTMNLELHQKNIQFF